MLYMLLKIYHRQLPQKIHYPRKNNKNYLIWILNENGYLVTLMHNSIRNTLAELLRRVCTVIETQKLSLTLFQHPQLSPAPTYFHSSNCETLGVDQGIISRVFGASHRVYAIHLIALLLLLLLLLLSWSYVRFTADIFLHISLSRIRVRSSSFVIIPTSLSNVDR